MILSKVLCEYISHINAQSNIIMSSRLPPLKPLRAFEATARTGSVTRAADELSVTHSAISHQIKTLENTLGLKLFDRSSQRLELTAHGALLLPVVSNAFQKIADATQQLYQPATSGRLSISCPPAFASYWLMPRLHQFMQQFPDIQLDLQSSVDKRAVFSHNTDVAILYGDVQRTDCWLSLWARFDLFPVISPTYLNRHSLRNLNDLPQQILLHADDGREWHTWLDAANALDLAPKKQHYLGDACLALDAALQGHGIALGDTLIAANLLNEGQLVVALELAVPTNDAFYIACRHEMRETPLVSVFINWLFSTLEQESSKPVINNKALRRRKSRSPMRTRQSTPLRT